MKIEIGKDYEVNKDSVLYPYYKTLTITKIRNIVNPGSCDVYHTKQGFCLFGRSGDSNKWNLDQVLKIYSLKEERKIKLKRINNRWWKLW